MPYIKLEDRGVIDEQLTPLLANIHRRSEGELNYILTRIVDGWVRGNEQPSYFVYSLGLAAFEAAKLEYYRRRLAPYEDVKCAANGDVYQQCDFKPLPAIELPGKDEANNESTKTV